MPPFRRIGITTKSDLPEKDDVLEQILDVIARSGAKACVDRKRTTGIACAKGLSAFASVEDIDLLLVMGGDGTILRAVRELENFSVPVLSVNRGNIGFLAEMAVEEIPTLLPHFLQGDGVRDVRSIVQITARRGTKIIHDGFVLNEATISQGSIARLIDLQTTVNGEMLTTFRADGLIIATPTGSTAYTLAAGGPIVHPKLPAMILTPINSHSFSQKPIVIPGGHAVEVEILSKENKFGDTEVSLTLDGQVYVTLHRHDRITASTSKRTVTFLRRREETFYSTLRTKLKWGERPEE